MIRAERARQKRSEGYSLRHDDLHSGEQLVRAAAVYASPEEFRPAIFRLLWPQGWNYKPTPEDRMRELVKAGALIAAEIDRLVRNPF